MTSIQRHLGWGAVAILGASAFGTVALHRGESINALWLVIAAVCTYLIAYRYYSLFIAEKGPGFVVSRKLKKLGYRAVESVALSFQDFRIPASRISSVSAKTQELFIPTPNRG